MVAHEWPTLLTVIMQANQLRRLAVGKDHPTVITLDMALYEKVVQLLDTRPDLKRTVVPRLANCTYPWLLYELLESKWRTLV